MKVKNNIPHAYIVSESSLNPQSIRDSMNVITGVKDWIEDHRLRNLNENLSDIEILPQIAGIMRGAMLGPTKEFNQNNVGNSSLYKHISISVIFTHVSCDFTNFMGVLGRSTLTLTDLSEDSISFWVNPVVLEEDKAALFYGKEILRTSEVINNLVKYMESNKQGDNKSCKEACQRLYPLVSQIHCLATSSLFDWKEIFLEGTQFSSRQEVRFVLLHLARKFKMKYSSVLSDLCLVDHEGNQFGLDTLTRSERAWETVRVTRKS
jgi:hypothetical protein